MNAPWIDPDVIARAMGDGTAGYVANDNRPEEPARCSWHTTAQIALLLIGSAIVGLTLFAWVSGR